jgi:selenide,water dikinase
MKIDLEKRRLVMQRSQLLGHCICDVRRPCPCDILLEQDLCPCAGERPPLADAAAVRLMDLSHSAGCASKIAPADLDAVLSRLPEVRDPAVVSGLAAADDAAIYRISDGLALVQTVDVFTPCVNDPFLFGKICAANCLSDIYAMGGVPRTALSILAFPSETLPGEIMFQMLSGAMEVLGNAGVALIGGHSIKDAEVKLGFAITGTIDPTVATALEKPTADDILVLTKPLGTGVLSFAQQVGRSYPEGVAQAQTSMATLNKSAADAMIEAGATACTDVTGFGLFGHLARMMKQGGVTAQVFADRLPAFVGVVEALREGVIPGAIERNREYVSELLSVAPGVDAALVHLGLDPQTSGGLLITVAPDRLGSLSQALHRRGVPCHVIGRIVARGTSSIQLVPSAPATPQAMSSVPDPVQIEPVQTVPSPGSGHEGCCSDVFTSSGRSGTAMETQRAFGAFLRSVQEAGVLTAKTKELITLALVIQSRCTPCFDTHWKKALGMGLTEAEIEEAAWCAVAMGGAPVRQFFNESLERLRLTPPAKS